MLGLNAVMPNPSFHRTLDITMNSKIIISVVIWLISLPLLGLQVIFSMAIIVEGGKQLSIISLQAPGTIEGLAIWFSHIVGLLSWVALLVMNIGWVNGKPVSLHWIIGGSISAIAGLTQTGLAQIITPMLFVAAPEIIFAIYLCYWHVRNGKQRSPDGMK